MTDQPATVQGMLSKGVADLRARGIDAPERDARLLMAHALEIDRARLTLHLHDPMPAKAKARFEAMIADRGTHRPVSQIIGGRFFFDRWFTVTPDVLDPRPETEILIEQALSEPFSNVLDLGTGSGAIIVTLLAERPEATGLATDLSPDALAIAQVNAVAHGVKTRLTFQVSDWFDKITEQFDLIVSNPPYIAADEMASLSQDVRGFEPHLALTDGADGLNAYRAIAAKVAQHLTPGGRVLLEIGPTQARAVSDLLATAGLIQIAIHTDLDGRDRVISACLPNAA